LVLVRDRFTVRDEHFPLVTTVYPTRMTLETLEPYFTDYERVLARREAFVSLVDMRPCVHVPSAAARREIAEWGLRIADERARYVRSVAFIVTHPMLRAALTAVHFIAPPRQPTVVVATFPAALTHLYNALREHGMRVPETPPADLGDVAR
jgi:hypothetical protein